MSVDLVSSFDVALLDRVVDTFFNSKSEQDRNNANKALMHFQQHSDSWKRVDAILETSTLLQTKFIALQILESLIKTMWKVLPQEQQMGIRTFIINIIIKTSSDDASLDKNKMILAKLNIVLVQILKQDWPAKWPQFIPEIVSSSKSNLSLCENNMAILKLLSEEIFDFSAEQMTQQKTKDLKNQMCGEFSEIFKLCFEILEKANKPSLLKATLETLLKFLNWIPLGYIFETNLIPLLVERFLANDSPAFRNVSLKCLAEIGALQVGQDYNPQFMKLFMSVLTAVAKIIPVDQDLTDIYENASDDDQMFIQNLSLFITSFLGAHLKLVETPECLEYVQTAHVYLVRISQVKEREIFKVCIEYWSKMVMELYEEVQSLSNNMPILSTGQRMMRKGQYTEILSRLRKVMIERMVKPEEVLIVENDEGEIVREFVKESDTIVVYKSMREILVYLTHLDVEDTEKIMTYKLSKQMDGSEWSWENLNTLCWAVGSISGAMAEDMEKRFLVSVIKDLLGLCEMKRGKDNKAVIASNIMYVVGQYPRFLKAHWKFLKTVVNKLFEFMHESHEGVQDMACDTFIKIAQKCKKHFVLQQANEVMPYIEEILSNLQAITSDLQPQQVHTFYEALGYMISAQPNRAVQERLIAKCMELPNTAWDGFMQRARQNVQVLDDNENVKLLGNIMKTNVSACVSIGSPFISQISRIYLDLLGLYKAVSQLISEAVQKQGAIAPKTPRVRGMRTIKKEILKLVETYVSKADDLAAVNTNLIPPLLEAILLDYRDNVADARDAEVLLVMATITNRLEGLMADKIAGVFDAVFDCTLSMISKNFEDYPEHRVGLYKLLFDINQKCFSALLQLPENHFKSFMNSVIWAIKHSMRDISDMGLQILVDLLGNFGKTQPSIANDFYRLYFCSILQDIFYVLTNSFYSSGFKTQTVILMQMFNMVEKIEAPLYEQGQATNNTDFLSLYVKNLLHNAFPHLNQSQITQFVGGLFTMSSDYAVFKNHVRDFLISLKEFAGNDLLADEREAEAQRKKDQERQNALAIPGMVKPSERNDDGMMD